MNITYACPHCHGGNKHEIDADTIRLSCSHCGEVIESPQGAIEGDRVNRCLVCPSTDLFVRKDFPQRVGVAIVLFGIIASSVAWGQTRVVWTFAILFGTALVDVVLYALVGNALMCYRCQAQYRGAGDIESHGPFLLETHERYRQMEARQNESR